MRGQKLHYGFRTEENNMSRDIVKKNIVIAAVLLMVVCLSGCKFRLAEISSSVMAPVKVTNPLEGQYRFKNACSMDNPLVKSFLSFG